MEATLTLVAGALTRLIALGIGGFLCYLGYRLFLDVPLSADSSAEIGGLKGVTVKLTRIGPGVFFALFGTSVVLWSLARPFEYRGIVQLPGGARVEQHAGSALATDPGNDRTARRNTVAQEVQWLNQVSAQLDAADRAALAHDPDYMVPRIKQVLMQSLWDGSDWGEQAAFARWLERTGGLEAPADPATARAAAFFSATARGE